MGNADNFSPKKEIVILSLGKQLLTWAARSCQGSGLSEGYLLTGTRTSQSSPCQL